MKRNIRRWILKKLPIKVLGWVADHVWSFYSDLLDVISARLLPDLNKEQLVADFSAPSKDWNGIIYQ